jgi:transcription elongation factor GreA
MSAPKKDPVADLVTKLEAAAYAYHNGLAETMTDAEYDAAKEAQGHHEAKIAQLESVIVSARVIEAKDIDISKVSILSKVTVTNLNSKKTVIYQIVSETEADLKQGKISVTSPIGKGLLGKQIGEIAEVTAPSGTFKFQIEHISI